MNKKDYTYIADKVEQLSFIKDSAVKFPRRYTNRKDIEVSGIFASWLAYGNREEYNRVVERLLILMDNKPYEYVMSDKWNVYKDDYTCLYRSTMWHNFAMLCNRLKTTYYNHEDLESAVIKNYKDNKFEYYYQSLCGLLSGETLIESPKSSSACGRMNTYLRWMVRQNSSVDIGIWLDINPSKLMVTCNSQTLLSAKKLGIVSRLESSKQNMIKIEKFAKKIFPSDPSRMDYVLYDANNIKD